MMKGKKEMISMEDWVTIRNLKKKESKLKEQELLL